MEITLIKHHGRLIIFQNREQILEVELPEDQKYLPMNVFPEFKEFFLEHAIFEPATTSMVLHVYEKWKDHFLLYLA